MACNNTLGGVEGRKMPPAAMRLTPLVVVVVAAGGGGGRGAGEGRSDCEGGCRTVKSDVELVSETGADGSVRAFDGVEEDEETKELYNNLRGAVVFVDVSDDIEEDRSDRPNLVEFELLLLFPRDRNGLEENKGSRFDEKLLRSASCEEVFIMGEVTAWEFQHRNRNTNHRCFSGNNGRPTQRLWSDSSLSPLFSDPSKV